MKINNCGRHNYKKHRDINSSDKCVTLNTSLKFDSMENMIITSSESKVKFGISGKGFITSLGLKSNKRQKK